MRVKTRDTGQWRPLGNQSEWQGPAPANPTAPQDVAQARKLVGTLTAPMEQRIRAYTKVLDHRYGSE